MCPINLKTYALDLVTRLARGLVPSADELVPIAAAADDRVPELYPAVALLRERLAPRAVHLCSIQNVKSGQCSEDCRFCTQSRASRAAIDVYPLLAADAMERFLVEHSRAPLNRASLVSSGRQLSMPEVLRVAEALRSARSSREPNVTPPPFCASLGLLDEPALTILKNAGLTRYHCNLETSRSHFPTICTTHTYNEKLATIRAARHVGLGLCVGGLFGVGESDLQVLELALELRDLCPDGVPINFLVSVPGAPHTSSPNLTPERCLKIIALMRFALPAQDLLVCGGRQPNLGARHVEVFRAGASGLMTGNYLTTLGRSCADDLQMLREIGESPRSVSPVAQ